MGDGQAELTTVSEQTLSPAAAAAASRRGYTITYNYALYFWRPYLGNVAFSLWQLLVSFCHDGHEECYPSLSRLARILSNSDASRALISGRGGRRPYPGALQRLCDEGLVQVLHLSLRGSNRYRFRVRRHLPLLRPEQVATLSPMLQRDHAEWLQHEVLRPLAAGAAKGLARETRCPEGTPNRVSREALRPEATAEGLQRDHAEWLARSVGCPEAAPAAVGLDRGDDYCSAPEAAHA